MEVFFGAIGGGEDGFDALAKLGLVEATYTKLVSMYIYIPNWRRCALDGRVVPIKKLVMDSL